MRVLVVNGGTGTVKAAVATVDASRSSVSHPTVNSGAASAMRATVF